MDAASVGAAIGIILGLTAVLAAMILGCSYLFGQRHQRGQVVKPPATFQQRPAAYYQLPPWVPEQMYRPQILQYPQFGPQLFQQYPLPGPQPFLPYQPYIQYYQPNQEYAPSRGPFGSDPELASPSSAASVLLENRRLTFTDLVNDAERRGRR